MCGLSQSPPTPAGFCQPDLEIRDDVSTDLQRLVVVPNHQHRVDLGHLPLPEFPGRAVAGLFGRPRHELQKRGEFAAPPSERLERQHEQPRVIRASVEAVADVLGTLERLYSCTGTL